MYKFYIKKKLESVLKSRDITLPMKTTAFPVVIHSFESWTIEKAKCQRIDAFELWFWRRLLNIPWTARRSNQSILTDISPEYSLEGALMWRADSFEKTLMLGKTGGEGDYRGWAGWMASPTRWTWVWTSSESWWWTGKPGPWGFKELDTTEWLNQTDSVNVEGIHLWSHLVLDFCLLRVF